MEPSELKATCLVAGRFAVKPVGLALCILALCITYIHGKVRA